VETIPTLFAHTRLTRLTLFFCSEVAPYVRGIEGRQASQPDGKIRTRHQVISKQASTSNMQRAQARYYSTVSCFRVSFSDCCSWMCDTTEKKHYCAKVTTSPSVVCSSFLFSAYPFKRGPVYFQSLFLHPRVPARNDERGDRHEQTRLHHIS
jgi:hypothetical protein